MKKILIFLAICALQTLCAKSAEVGRGYGLDFTKTPGAPGYGRDHYFKVLTLTREELAHSSYAELTPSNPDVRFLTMVTINRYPGKNFEVLLGFSCRVSNGRFPSISLGQFRRLASGNYLEQNVKGQEIEQIHLPVTSELFAPGERATLIIREDGEEHSTEIHPHPIEVRTESGERISAYLRNSEEFSYELDFRDFSKQDQLTLTSNKGSIFRAVRQTGRVEDLCLPGQAFATAGDVNRTKEIWCGAIPVTDILTNKELPDPHGFTEFEIHRAGQVIATLQLPYGSQNIPKWPNLPNKD